MSIFPDWEKYCVHQRNALTGCIPTGYEMLLRAANVTGIDFNTFQEEFDLDLNRPAGSEFKNNFGSVASKIKDRYPQVEFRQESFPTGAEKLAFIEERLAAGNPILASLPAFDQFGRHIGWHIMPIVDATSDSLCLLRFVHADGKKETEWVAKSRIVELHDTVPGGKEVAFLDV